ncbi:hypothetical protein TUM4637_11260 [Shewanella hafniensis]|uniref:hypothetical protein n=1 Tax=Shewanella sp. Pdp11 TaxID=2059264 RepID=UPI000CA0C722|nr:MULTISPECIES: hypothetical protein [Shewanella]AUD58915.1 hypothetical protein AYJ58_05165 [Shewanella sp. Pdp11]MCL1135053.1 hypothetical protein [Shewanella hafniensis]GIU25676.1 hypothetical protein TUM4637_11260 [Shewanella hafniensis]
MRLILIIVISCLFLPQARAETSAVVWQAHCRDRHPVIYVEKELKQMAYVDISKNGRYFSIPLMSPQHQYAKQVHQIVDDMRTSGEITQLFKSYGVEPPLNLTESPLATH